MMCLVCNDVKCCFRKRCDGCGLVVCGLHDDGNEGMFYCGNCKEMQHVEEV